MCSRNADCVSQLPRLTLAGGGKGRLIGEPLQRRIDNGVGDSVGAFDRPDVGDCSPPHGEIKNVGVALFLGGEAQGVACEYTLAITDGVDLRFP